MLFPFLLWPCVPTAEIQSCRTEPALSAAITERGRLLKDLKSDEG